MICPLAPPGVYRPVKANERMSWRKPEQRGPEYSINEIRDPFGLQFISKFCLKALASQQLIVEIAVDPKNLFPADLLLSVNNRSMGKCQPCAVGNEGTRLDIKPFKFPLVANHHPCGASPECTIDLTDLNIH